MSSSSDVLQYGDEIALQFMPTNDHIQNDTGVVSGHNHRVDGYVVGTPERTDAAGVRFASSGCMQNQTQCRLIVHTAEQYEAAKNLLQFEDEAAKNMVDSSLALKQTGSNSHTKTNQLRKTLSRTTSTDKTASADENNNPQNAEEILKKQANAEDAANKNEFELKTGQPIAYGDKIQLLNSMSTQFLQGDKRVATEDTTALRVKLSHVQHGRSKGSLWEIIPGFRK